MLEEAGLVSSLRVGRESRFTYRPEPIAEARSYLAQMAAQWDDGLSRLRALGEEV